MTDLQHVEKTLYGLDIPPLIQQRLLERNLITAKEVLGCNVVDLVELLDISESEAMGLIREVSLSVAPAFCTALQLYQEQSQSRPFLSTGLPGLDASLRGGYPVGGITELVGPAGVGKSQFCFCAALRVALPFELGGLEGNVVFIDTERKFSPHRMKELARAQFPQQNADWSALQPVLDRIILYSPETSEQLLRCLQGLQSVIATRSARLLVLDSAAALMRMEFSGAAASAVAGAAATGPPIGSVMERQELLGQQAAQLKLLAEKFKLPVIVTNQVMARMADPTNPSAAQDGGDTGAALGTKWAHCVNIRLVLERQAQLRLIKVAKSPASGMNVFAYSISRAGVQQDTQALGVEALGGLQQGSVLELGIRQ